MDLNKQPPRRPTNMGMAGIAGLARMTDKARGHNDEQIGEYVYGDASGLDKGVLEFLGMSADEYAEAADSMDDGELSELALKKSGKDASEIAAFSKAQVEREPQDDRHRQLLVERVATYAPERTDVKTVYQSKEQDDWGMFRELDLTAVVVTHDIALARKVADRILLLNEGTVHVCDTAERVLHSKDPIVRRFLEGTSRADALERA